jgi:hypothetical protein
VVASFKEIVLPRVYPEIFHKIDHGLEPTENEKFLWQSLSPNHHLNSIIRMIETLDPVKD